MKQRFPAQTPPVFPELRESNDCVAYSFLEARVPFPLPYLQNRQALLFTNGNGTSTEINSFGLPDGDVGAFFKLRDQPRILYFKMSETNWYDLEFALDLCSNSAPSQIIVAKITPQKTLLATIERTEREIQGKDTEPSGESPYIVRHSISLGHNDSLLVPDLNWFVSHHFSALENRAIVNDKFTGYHFRLAQQDIRFRLGKNGAELKSNASLYAEAASPMHYIIDRPFLVYMKKRGAQTPYFVMWVDNAELLSPFGSKETNAVALPKAK
jgi:hypothetical protein